MCFYFCLYFLCFYESIHRVCVYKWAYCWVLPYFSVACYANTIFVCLTRCMTDNYLPPKKEKTKEKEKTKDKPRWALLIYMFIVSMQSGDIKMFLPNCWIQTYHKYIPNVHLIYLDANNVCFSTSALKASVFPSSLNDTMIEDLHSIWNVD